MPRSVISPVLRVAFHIYEMFEVQYKKYLTGKQSLTNDSSNSFGPEISH
jgi:hypothetical protein